MPIKQWHCDYHSTISQEAIFPYIDLHRKCTLLWIRIGYEITSSKYVQATFSHTNTRLYSSSAICFTRFWIRLLLNPKASKIWVVSSINNRFTCITDILSSSIFSDNEWDVTHNNKYLFFYLTTAYVSNRCMQKTKNRLFRHWSMYCMLNYILDYIINYILNWILKNVTLAKLYVTTWILEFLYHACERKFFFLVISCMCYNISVHIYMHRKALKNYVHMFAYVCRCVCMHACMYMCMHMYVFVFHKHCSFSSSQITYGSKRSTGRQHEHQLSQQPQPWRRLQVLSTYYH